MGLFKAAVGAVGGTLADQWVDFLTVPENLAPTAALFPAVRVGTNQGRGSNTEASQAIVTNGSTIVVPEGYGLLLVQDGELTAFTNEPGAYVWNSDAPDSQSLFAGDGPAAALLHQSWGRFKFGGRPQAQQLALFISLKELPNNKFGTQSPIYWDDAYFNAQVGVVAHGTYSMRIMNPIQFVKSFVPATYLQGQRVFDFTDRDNDAASQLFSEVVGALSAAFSAYTNHAERGNRITNIQQDSVGFATLLAQAVEDAYYWQATRGLYISNVNVMAIRYDETTQELLQTVQRADALTGSRGNSNLQASVASGIEAAGAEGGAGGILGMGFAAGSMGLPALQQDSAPVIGAPASSTPADNPPADSTPASSAPVDSAPVSDAPVSDEPTDSAPATATPQPENELLSQLESLKKAFEAGLIEQAEFDAAKAKALGLS